MPAIVKLVAYDAVAAVTAVVANDALTAFNTYEAVVALATVPITLDPVI